MRKWPAHKGQCWVNQKCVWKYVRCRTRITEGKRMVTGTQGPTGSGKLSGGAEKQFLRNTANATARPHQPGMPKGVTVYCQLPISYHLPPITIQLSYIKCSITAAWALDRKFLYISWCFGCLLEPIGYLGVSSGCLGDALG